MNHLENTSKLDLPNHVKFFAIALIFHKQIDHLMIYKSNNAGVSIQFKELGSNSVIN